MDKEEIKDYLKRADELELKLTGEDKDTYQWILFGYNQCAKLLNETEQQCKKQKEVIDDYKEDISNLLDIINKNCNELKCTSDELLVIQKYQDKEVSE